MKHAHQIPETPDDIGEPDSPAPGDRSNDWPDKEEHAPDEVREPPQPHRLPIEDPKPLSEP